MKISVYILNFIFLYLALNHLCPALLTLCCIEPQKTIYLTLNLKNKLKLINKV